MEGREGTTEMAPPGPAKALIVVAALIPLIGAYLGLGMLLGLHSLWAGFLFLLYWGGIKHMSGAEFLPAVFGALGGIIMAFLMHWLPAQHPAAGLGALLLILIAIYLLVRRQLDIVINNAFMLFLTVGTIPQLAASHPLEMAACVILAAAYAGGLLWLALNFSARRSAKAASPAG